jgi:hypothetical protein
MLPQFGTVAVVPTIRAYVDGFTLGYDGVVHNSSRAAFGIEVVSIVPLENKDVYAVLYTHANGLSAALTCSLAEKIFEQLRKETAYKVAMRCAAWAPAQTARFEH